ncbi:MAG: DUF4136 domain-containing protein [Pseudomonadota bacterium]
MRVALAAVLLLPLSACASLYGTVSRTQSMPPPGQSFAIHGFTPAYEQAPGFKNRTHTVAAQLVAHGYRESADDQHADLIVQFGYRIGAAHLSPISRVIEQTTVSAATETVISRSVVSDSAGNAQIVEQTRSDPGSSETSYRTYNPVVHDGVLLLRIVRRDTGAVVFDGSVNVEANVGNADMVVPAMISAMFRRFPGKSGSIETIGTMQ